MTPFGPEDATLVLGGSGFLGVHLVAAARSRAAFFATDEAPGGPLVVSASRRPREAPGVARGPGAVEAGTPAVRSFDGSRPGSAEALLEELRPQRVLLATALARVGDCRRDPQLARRLNTELPREVAAWCAPRGVRLVFVSTDLVFGGRPPMDERYTEEDPPSPVHAYGETKRDGEDAVLEASQDALVVRLPLLYGDSLQRGSGATDSLFAALGRGERPSLFVDEWRTPLEVRNAATLLVDLLDGEERGLLHLAGRERVNRLELGLRALEAAGLERARAEELVQAARRADLGLADERPEDTSLDASRAVKLLGTPPLDLGAGLLKAVREIPPSSLPGQGG